MSLLRDSVGWSRTFAFLAPGPAVGIVAMLYRSEYPATKERPYGSTVLYCVKEDHPVLLDSERNNLNEIKLEAETFMEAKLSALGY